MNCLGIDIGSSSIKGAVLLVDEGRIGPLARAPFPSAVTGLPAGHFEVEPTEIVDAVRQVVEQLLAQQPDAQRLLCSGQMGGTLLVDAAGRAVTRYLSWRDQRSLEPTPAGNSYLDEVAQRIDPVHMTEIGQELKAGSATSLLYWLALQKKLPRGARPLSLGDYVVAQLCQAEPRTEPTSAIGTLNLMTGNWHFKLFERLGLGGLQWPELADFHQPVGTMRCKGRELICHPVVGDHQCALLGIGIEEGDLSINVSTGSQVSQLTADLRLGAYQSRAFFGRYLNTITHLPAGRSLNVLVDLLTELRPSGQQHDDPWPQIIRAADQAADSELSVDLAFFAGPMGNRGSIREITVDNLTVGGLFRAALHNMADNYAVCSRRLVPQADWQRVILSGGLPQKIPLLGQLIRERLPGQYRDCPEAEDTLLGLLQLARMLGRY